ERGAHGALGDLVEGDAVDVLLLERQLLSQMPADRLPFPVGVGGDVERVGLLGGLLEVVENLLLGRRDHVLGLEVLLGIHAELGLRQVAHVSHGGLDDVLAVQVLRDRLHLRGGLDHHEPALGHYALLARVAVATQRWPASCRAWPAISRAISAAPTRAASTPARAINRSMCCGSSTVISSSIRASSLPGAGSASPSTVVAALTRLRHGSGNSATISVQCPTSLAPSRMRPFAPRLAAEGIRPGTADTSRPRAPGNP